MTSSPLYGLDAGTPTLLFCPPGQYISNIQGKLTRQGISSVSLTCNQGTVLGTVGSETFGSPFEIDCQQGITNLITNVDETVVENIFSPCDTRNRQQPIEEEEGADFSCKDGEKMVGAEIYGVDKVVGMKWWCANIPSNDETSESPQWGAIRTGQDYVMACPIGKEMTGLRGTAGPLGISSLGLVCNNIQLPTVGSAVGNQFSLDCGAKSIEKIGATASMTGISTINAVCAGRDDEDEFISAGVPRTQPIPLFECPEGQSLQAAIIRSGRKLQGLQFLCGPKPRSFQANGGFPIWGIILAIVAIIVVLGFIYLYYRRSRRRSS